MLRRGLVAAAAKIVLRQRSWRPPYPRVVASESSFPSTESAVGLSLAWHIACSFAGATLPRPDNHKIVESLSQRGIKLWTTALDYRLCDHAPQ